MKLRLLIFLLLVVNLVFAQVSSNPALPVATQKVTIIFDSSKETQLGYYTGDLYTHTGVILEGNPAWQHVIGSWGINSSQPKLTNKGGGIYELEITPNINSYYSVTGSGKVVKMAFVFRSADAKKQTKDLFVNVYQEGLVVEITQPANNSILMKGQPVNIVASASVASELKLKLNGDALAQNAGTSVSVSKTFSESGNYLIVAEATASGTTVRDSAYVCVKADVVNQTKPAAYLKGINYPDDNTAALVLWAPGKQYVYVLGDFNEWKPSNDYLMKKDGDYFWLEIPNLIKGKEYLFQYYIDNKVKIADPYTEKIADPANDKWIPSATYPGLPAYSEGKTEGVASVLQPGQVPYAWQVENFRVPDKHNLVIYELLIRDFTSDHSYRSVMEKLDYLSDLRVNVLELMPVNEFEGNSSWGYNPGFYFAPDKYYGPKNDLKKLIDECHKRGIAVVIDMVLNHSYGLSPFVQMYMNNWTITSDNPWYNITSPNPVYSWGYDFNHESATTRELVDSVNSFWINEYKVDGFRFDFTKGFTNTTGDGWAYDASRITILKRMYDEIRKRKQDAIVIFEHLSDNLEEKVLADYGILLWGNMNGKYGEAAMGYAQGNNSDLSWGLYSSRNWTQPNLVTYQESHDEERLAYKCEQYGKIENDYNIKQVPTTLKRLALNYVFQIPLPGPKMIWQFGERGYDVSINDFGGRLGEKPPRWEYLDDTNRLELFRTVAKLNFLKQTYDEFSSPVFSGNLVNDFKYYNLNKGDQNVFVIGNFGTLSRTESLLLPATGTWYEYFTKTTLQVNTIAQTFTLAPGEFRLYSTRRFDDPTIKTNLPGLSQSGKILLYPNPATEKIFVSSDEPISAIFVYNSTGCLVESKTINEEYQTIMDVKGYGEGLYIFKIISGNKEFYCKSIIH